MTRKTLIKRLTLSCIVTPIFLWVFSLSSIFAAAVWGRNSPEAQESMIAQPTPIRIAELLGTEARSMGDSCEGHLITLHLMDLVRARLREAPGPKKVLPSVGSAMHELGTCKPCAWFWKTQGCKNGRDCLHCHLCSSTEVRHRKKQRALEKKRFRPPPGLSLEPDSPVSTKTEQSSSSRTSTPSTLAA